MPDFPVDPAELVRGLENLRSALLSPGNTEEVAKLNANVERALPLIESIEQDVKRTMPVVDSLQSLRRSRRRRQPGVDDDQQPPDPRASDNP
jgi:hypothetical protein